MLDGPAGRRVKGSGGASKEADVTSHSSPCPELFRPLYRQCESTACRSPCYPSLGYVPFFHTLRKRAIGTGDRLKPLRLRTSCRASYGVGRRPWPYLRTLFCREKGVPDGCTCDEPTQETRTYLGAAQLCALHAYGLRGQRERSAALRRRRRPYCRPNLAPAWHPPSRDERLRSHAIRRRHEFPLEGAGRREPRPS